MSEPNAEFAHWNTVAERRLQKLARLGSSEARVPLVIVRYYAEILLKAIIRAEAALGFEPQDEIGKAVLSQSHDEERAHAASRLLNEAGLRPPEISSEEWEEWKRLDSEET